MTTERGQGLNLLPHGHWSDLLPLGHNGNPPCLFFIQIIFVVIVSIELCEYLRILDIGISLDI